jgi:3-oxoacyl-[acyl-carrier protein] reductase
MDLFLEKKRVLITGGSRGIGAASARSFLMEGAKVFIVSRGSNELYDTKEQLISEFGEKNIEVAECDCSDPKSLSSLKKQIVNKWDGLDILIANVGNGSSVPDDLPDEEQWDKTWKNNFDSGLHTVRAFLDILKESKGSILFVSSITAMEAFGAPVDYSTAKTAIAALSKNLARKLALEVRVNAVAPGNVLFEGSSWDQKVKKNPGHVYQMINSTVPMERFCKPEEVADAIVFLSSERASFITGSILVIDGGQTVGVF